MRKGDFQVESSFEGILLLFNHRDTPGVIGKVGALFGKHRVNIAQMSVGRVSDQPGGQAVGVLTLDSQPPAEALTELLSLDAISRASIVKLPAANDLPAWMGG